MNQVVRVFPTAALSLQAATGSFLAACRARNLSVCTVRYYSDRLAQFSAFVGEVLVSEISSEDIRRFLASELDRVAATTVQHAYTALCAFFGYLEREGHISENPMQRVEKPKRKKTIIQPLSEAQVERLLGTCGRDFYGVRDRAILCLLLDSGLRASELCGLALEDLDLDQQTVLVLGKGNKERIVPFGRVTRQALVTYLARREGVRSERLFVNHYGQPLTRSGLHDLVARRGKQVGITGVRCSPHSLRHTMAISFLRRGGDCFTLQTLLGHSSLDMSRKYAAVADCDVLEKHRLFSPVDGLKGAAPKNGRRRLR